MNNQQCLLTWYLYSFLHIKVTLYWNKMKERVFCRELKLNLLFKEFISYQITSVKKKTGKSYNNPVKKVFETISTKDRELLARTPFDNRNRNRIPLQKFYFLDWGLPSTSVHLPDFYRMSSRNPDQYGQR